MVIKGGKTMNNIHPSINEHHLDMYTLCSKHVSRYVQLKTIDGVQIKGFIEHVDYHSVYLLIPDHTDDDLNSYRYGLGYPGYGYGFPGYGYGYPGYGYGYGLRRLILPLTALAAFSLLW